MIGYLQKELELISFPVFAIWTLCVDAVLGVQRNVLDATQEVLIQSGISNADCLVLVKGPQYPI